MCASVDTSARQASQALAVNLNAAKGLQEAPAEVPPIADAAQAAEYLTLLSQSSKAVPTSKLRQRPLHHHAAR